MSECRDRKLVIPLIEHRQRDLKNKKMQLIPSTTSKPKNAKVDDLVVKRKGGGSIIDHRPLFSNDGEILYVVWKQVIRTYSTQTGDFVREFEPTDNKIIGIAYHVDDVNTIMGCTETGDLVNWNIQNGLIIKKLKLDVGKDVRISTFNIVRYGNQWGKYFCQVLVSYVTKDPNFINLTLLDLKTGSSVKSLKKELLCNEYYIDVIGNHGSNLIALVHDVDLQIMDPARGLSGRLHKIGLNGRTLTCVAGHPDEEIVATGDSSGRVVVWKNLHLTRPVQGSYHWHTLPVTEIAFSKSGGHMYTGGSECVLVKWNLANPHNKYFLPRLPAPIKHLTIAPENLYVAVSTLDNGIVVVNPQQRLTASIQNFTWGVTASRKDLFPAGLTLDPRTNSLVLNSRTGYVQFFDTNTKNLLYNVHITAQNLLTQERSVIIVNTEVTKIALNNDGSWMATVEERDDKISSIEVRLKFWNFDMQRQLFTLNTSIELPHEFGVNALQFQPNASLDNDFLLAVTTGKDHKFKIWNLAEPTSIYKNTKHWQCYGIGTYRNLPSMDAGFAIDGSLLGVSFGPSLTMWIPESSTLKCSLTHSRYPQTITHVQFGRHQSCHLVVVGSSEHIAVWNLLTLSITWSVPLKLTTLTADPSSPYMAAFTSDNSLFVFTPQSPRPVYTRQNIVDSESFVLGACFVPHPREKQGTRIKPWQRKSQLFFLDSNQELLTLESESEANISLENLTISGSLPATAFSSLVAAEATVAATEGVQPYIHEQLSLPGKGVAQELLTVSAHTLPPMRMLCAPFVLSLRMHNTQKTRIHEDKFASDLSRVSRGSRTENGSEDDDDDEEENDDNENLQLAAGNNKRISDSQRVEADKNLELNSDILSYDWSFLASILPSDTKM